MARSSLSCMQELALVDKVILYSRAQEEGSAHGGVGKEVVLLDQVLRSWIPVLTHLHSNKERRFCFKKK